MRQERATRISHGNTARLAKEAGDVQLARAAGLIAADEARHEEAYKRIVAKVRPEGCGHQQLPSGASVTAAADGEGGGGEGERGGLAPAAAPSLGCSCCCSCCCPQPTPLLLLQVLELDPDGGVQAFADMIGKGVVMPAHLMTDGTHRERHGREMFADYASVAERLGDASGSSVRGC